MENLPVHPPLSNVQVELLKLFSTNVADSDLLELKKVMAKFLFENGRNKADAIWDERGYSDEKLQELLNIK